jgi:UDP-glucose 4-epimerase
MLEWMRAAGPRPFRYHLDLEIGGALVPETWSRRLF